jgi:O-antigen ligase
MALLGLCPLVADALILVGASPGSVWKFVQGSQQIGQSIEAEVQVQRGVVRYFSAGTAGQLLLVGFLSWINVNRLLSIRGFWLIPLPLAFFGLTLFGGFRLGILNFLLIGLIVAFLQRAFTLARIFLGCFLLIAGWFVLVETSPYLPPGAQRAIAWVPGTDIPEFVKRDASSTVEWRLQLWEEGMKKLPEYWLIGKGYAFSEKEAVAVSGANKATDQLSWAIVTSSYHNGPISLLLGLGVFGLIVGFALIFAICIRHGRMLKAPWRDPRLKQIHQVIYAMLLVHVTVFLTIYGDVQVSFPPLFFMFALLEGLCAADKKLESAKTEHPTTQRRR